MYFAPSCLAHCMHLYCRTILRIWANKPINFVFIFCREVCWQYFMVINPTGNIDVRWAVSNAYALRSWKLQMNAEPEPPQACSDSEEQTTPPAAVVHVLLVWLHRCSFQRPPLHNGATSGWCGLRRRSFQRPPLPQGHVQLAWSALTQRPPLHSGATSCWFGLRRRSFHQPALNNQWLSRSARRELLQNASVTVCDTFFINA